jgi:hypothetical protein
MMRTTLARTGAGWLLVGALLAAMPSGARAGQTPAQKCSVAKSKAAAKKIEAKLKCQQRAVQEGTAVDPACVATAETKFNEAIAKAEAPGGCAMSGDGATIEAAVDSCVDSIATLTTGMPSNPGCCSFPPQSANVPFPGCTMDLALCPSLSGTVESGVCRNDGTCGPATGPGACCNFAPGECLVVDSSGLTQATQTACSLISGTFASNAVCTATGCE